MKLEDFLDANKIEESSDIKYEIRKIKATEDYVLLFLDDEKIMISLENYFRYNVKDLKGLDDKLYYLFKHDETLLKAYRGCLRKISGKDHTVKQIREYLHRFELNGSEIDELVKRLMEYGLLDDEKYCISKINYYNGSNLSNRQIRTRLNKDGVDEEIINRYLTGTGDYEKALKQAEKLSRNKNRSTNGLKQSILLKLTGNGFSYDIAKKAVDSLNINNENELELLKKEYLKAYNRYARKYEDHDLKNHVYAYLLGKGFKSEDINEVSKEFNDG